MNLKPVIRVAVYDAIAGAMGGNPQDRDLDFEATLRSIPFVRKRGGE